MRALHRALTASSDPGVALARRGEVARSDSAGRQRLAAGKYVAGVQLDELSTTIRAAERPSVGIRSDVDHGGRRASGTFVGVPWISNYDFP